MKIPFLLISRIKLISTTLVPRVLYFFTLRFGAAAVVTSKSSRNGGTDLVYLALQNTARFPVFSFFMSPRFLNVLPSVCHLFYCSPCTTEGGDETPAGLVFTLIRPPSRISIMLFVYRILRVVLNMLHCLVIYVPLCLPVGCNFGETLRTVSLILRVANIGNLG